MNDIVKAAKKSSPTTVGRARTGIGKQGAVALMSRGGAKSPKLLSDFCTRKERLFDHDD